MDWHGLVQEYLLHVHIYHQIFSSSLFFTCRDEEPVEINYNIAVGKDGTNQFLQFVMFHMYVQQLNCFNYRCMHYKPSLCMSYVDHMTMQLSAWKR